MKRFFVGLVLLHALSWGEQAVYAQVLDVVNSKYTFGPIKGFTAILSLLLAGLLVFTLYGVHPRTAKAAYAGAAVCGGLLVIQGVLLYFFWFDACLREVSLPSMMLALDLILLILLAVRGSWLGASEGEKTGG